MPAQNKEPLEIPKIDVERARAHLSAFARGVFPPVYKTDEDRAVDAIRAEHGAFQRKHPLMPSLYPNDLTPKP